MSAFSARHPWARRTEVTTSWRKEAETTKEAALSKAITTRNHAFSGGGLAGEDSQRVESWVTLGRQNKCTEAVAHTKLESIATAVVGFL